MSYDPDRKFHTFLGLGSVSLKLGFLKIPNQTGEIERFCEIFLWFLQWN